MPRAPTELLAPDAELIFGLVGAVGTDLRRFQGILQNQLQSCGYSSIAIKMSDLIEAGLGASLPSPLNEAERIRSRMKGPQGGLYWPGKHDHRDHVLGYDSNDAAKKKMLEEVIPRVVVWARAQMVQGSSFQFERFIDEIDKELEALTDSARLIDQAAKLLKDASIMDITEYGRAVHAEMEAILSCTRTGQSTRGAILYCTTFPCHNCAKHIIDAGICWVVYVQPYPKSKAEELHGDAIFFKNGAVKPSSFSTDAVQFEPFDGVGPRRFLDPFLMNLGQGYDVERKGDGKIKQWTRPAADSEYTQPVTGPRVPMRPNSYLEREELIVHAIKHAIKKEETK